MSESADEADLPLLQSIELGGSALAGDWRDDRKTSQRSPFNWKNSLVMRSGDLCGSEWIDLPSLISFKGNTYNFENIGPVVLESSDVCVD